jgi:hypothetical protein
VASRHRLRLGKSLAGREPVITISLPFQDGDLGYIPAWLSLGLVMFS